jgi:hypothetical protein
VAIDLFERCRKVIVCAKGYRGEWSSRDNEAGQALRWIMFHDNLTLSIPLDLKRFLTTMVLSHPERQVTNQAFTTQFGLSPKMRYEHPR